MMIVLWTLFPLATLALLAWIYILLHPARPWDLQPIAEDVPPPEPLAEYPPVAIVVPARNEAESLPHTLPALLRQDYPGPYRVFLVDDRSEDGTAAVARTLASQLGQSDRLTVLTGQSLPAGWTGKVWAMTQGLKAALAQGHAAFVMFTDADIAHASGSLKRLAGESSQAQLGMNSRMARLRCVSSAEKWLIPAFLYFFNLLYPMRQANNPRHPLAAAAGGCVLLSQEAIARLGGTLEAIRGAVIDDVNLARQVKGHGLPIRLSICREDVRSLREYPRLADVWKMVQRTAFTELRCSWLRLSVALAGLSLLFAVPLVSIMAGALALALGGPEWFPLAAWVLAKGGLSLVLMRTVYGPSVAYFQLPRRYAWLLPAAGALYGLMTLDSALRHASGQGVQWRDPPDNSQPVFN